MNFSRLSSAINSLLAASKRCNATSDPGWYCGRSIPSSITTTPLARLLSNVLPPTLLVLVILPMKFQRDKEQTALLHHLDRLHWRVWCTLAEQNLDRVVARTWVCIVRRQFARIPFLLTPRDAARWRDIGRHAYVELVKCRLVKKRSPAEATLPNSAD